MKKILVAFLLVLSFYPLLLQAQSRKPKPAAVAPTPPRPRVPPPQYLLKKDFDAKFSELESRVRSAQNAGASARNQASMYGDSIQSMSYKISEIESILNSANFKITLNEDSLKTTQSRIDELRADADKTYKEINAKAADQAMLIWVLLGLCIVLPGIVFAIMLMQNRKIHLELRNLSERVSNDLQKNYISLQDAMKSLRTNVEGEVYSIKADAHHKLVQETDVLKRNIRDLQSALDQKQDKPVETGE
ncbi:MAG: hypothetical protein WC760_10525 [Bacteroidia bacterium]|jgi:chromosome segregation ATPase